MKLAYYAGIVGVSTLYEFEELGDEKTENEMAAAVVPAVVADLRQLGYLLTHRGDYVWMRGICLILEYERDQYCFNLWRLTDTGLAIGDRKGKVAFACRSDWDDGAHLLFRTGIDVPTCFESLYAAIKEHGKTVPTIEEAIHDLKGVLCLNCWHDKFRITAENGTIVVSKLARWRLYIELGEGWRGFPCVVRHIS